MKYADVAENVKKLVASPPAKDEFIYELLLAYGTPKATIARLKSGAINLSKEPNEVLLKKKAYFKAVAAATHSAVPAPLHGRGADAEKIPSTGGVAAGRGGSDLFAAMEALKAEKKIKANDPRFLIVTDFKQILAVDRKTGDTLDVDFQGLETHVDFFLPWAGMEKTKLSNENPANVKAAEKMAKLFDAIRQDNADYLRHDAHAMNVFLGRLLFCLFAEDTNIFPENAVSNAIASHTADDGSDLDVFFKQLFDWLDLPDAERGFDRKDAKNAKGEQDQVFHASGRSAGAETTTAEGRGWREATAENEVNGNHTNDTKKKVGQASCLSADEESLRSLRSFTVNSLPYVNGGLFRDHYDIPGFSRKSRRMLIEAGTLDWKDINPDIFGSMFQAVIDPEERHNLEMAA